jgi:hypothetical protein
VYNPKRIHFHELLQIIHSSLTRNSFTQARHCLPTRSGCTQPKIHVLSEEVDFPFSHMSPRSPDFKNRWSSDDHGTERAYSRPATFEDIVLPAKMPTARSIWNPISRQANRVSFGCYQFFALSRLGQDPRICSNVGRVDFQFVEGRPHNLSVHYM